MKNIDKAAPKERDIKKIVLQGFFLLGVFSILCGIGLVIAANWALIPAYIKILSGMVVLSLSLVATYFAHTNGRRFITECLLFVSFLLILGNMALIQQSYNLYISLEKGCLIWGLLSLPLLPFTKKWLLPVCVTVLFGLSLWEYLLDVWKYIDFLGLAALFFILTIVGFMLGGKRGNVLSWVSPAMMFIMLLIQDINDGSLVGAISSIVFIIIMVIFYETDIDGKRTIDSLARWFNVLFVLVAFRIIMLFWKAYENLASMGYLLIGFGSVIMIISGLYYYYYDRLNTYIKKVIKQ